MPEPIYSLQMLKEKDLRNLLRLLLTEEQYSKMYRRPYKAALGPTAGILERAWQGLKPGQPMDLGLAESVLSRMSKEDLLRETASRWEDIERSLNRWEGWPKEQQELFRKAGIASETYAAWQKERETVRTAERLGQTAGEVRAAMTAPPPPTTLASQQAAFGALGMPTPRPTIPGSYLEIPPTARKTTTIPGGYMEEPPEAPPTPTTPTEGAKKKFLPELPSVIKSPDDVGEGYAEIGLWAETALGQVKLGETAQDRARMADEVAEILERKQQLEVEWGNRVRNWLALRGQQVGEAEFAATQEERRLAREESAAGRAQSAAQFSETMAFSREQERNNLAQAYDTLMQQQAQIMAQLAQYTVPEGMQYVPGLEPGGAITRAFQGANIPFEATPIVTTPVRMPQPTGIAAALSRMGG